jgi:diguanylate cyclase (GGDEF)-like protein
MESIQAFKRNLPRRLEGLRASGRRLRTNCWDVNVLALLSDQVSIALKGCTSYQVTELIAPLTELQALIRVNLSVDGSPSKDQFSEFEQKLADLTSFNQFLPPAAEHVQKTEHSPPIDSGGISLFVIPPNAFIDLFAKSILPLSSTPKQTSAQTPVSKIEPAATSLAEQLNDATITAFNSDQKELIAEHSLPDTPKDRALARSPQDNRSNRYLFHLHLGSTLDLALDQRLTSNHFTVEKLDNADDLTEIIQALTPTLVLVSSDFLNDIERIGDIVRVTRSRINQPIMLVVTANASDIALRLKAMRAGVDAFITLPLTPDEIQQRIEELLNANVADPFRVLIIEDDRAQALFAESILRKAGMDTRAVMDPLAALDALNEFKPELVLMDLYMPGCDGMELTTLIREREEFANTPIVFLSGEHDADKRFDALSAGGDDYLEKPIRPKYLISAVTNRVRRARALNQRVGIHHARDPVTGLYHRGYFIERLAHSLLEEPDTHLGGLLFMIIDGAQAIRDRIGLSAFDTLLGQAGALLASLITNQDMAARYGDTSFVILAPGYAEQALVTFAEEIKTRFEKHIFEFSDKSLALAVNIGIAPLVQGWSDTSSILNAAERACAQARVDTSHKVHLYETPSAAQPTSEKDLLLTAIQDAVRNQRFELLFQPIASLSGDAEEQFQVLLRLRDSRGRVHTAAEIVPLAEEFELIDAVDRWVLSRCLKLLQERDRIDRPIRLFVSQSIAAFDDTDRVQWLNQLIQSHQISSNRLVIELRATDVQSYLHRGIEFCTAARHAGLRISLTGFEASTSSYQMLQHLAIDYLKLSAKYVGSSAHLHQRELKQLIDFAHNRAIYIVAPLVEHAQTASDLWSAGVDFIQGDFVQQATQDLDFDFIASGG